MALEEDLRALADLDVHDGASRPYLEGVLKRKSGILIGAAADRIREAELTGFEPRLVQAFHTLCERPVQRDPGCRGKLGVVRALDAQRSHEVEVFERAVAWVQLEPSWGPPTDTAGPVRTVALFALVAQGHPEAMGWVADQLADPLPTVRAEAARAAASMGELAAPLLRLKLRVGDADDAALGEALAALCELDAARGLELAERWLQADARHHEIAALSLAQSRLDAAVPLLDGAIRRAISDRTRRTLLIALGTMRLDAAREVLLDHLDGPDLHGVLEALAPYRFDRRTLGMALDRVPREHHVAVRAALDPDL